MKERTAARWNATDVARLIYGKYKGLTGKQLAFFVDRSIGSIYQTSMYLKDASSASKNMQRVITNGQILEAKIRSGQSPDQRRLWDEQIGRLRGVTYSYKEPEAKQEIKPEEPKPIEVQKVTGANERKLVSIIIDADAVLQIIKAWRSNDT